MKLFSRVFCEKLCQNRYFGKIHRMRATSFVRLNKRLLLLRGFWSSAERFFALELAFFPNMVYNIAIKMRRVSNARNAASYPPRHMKGFSL